MSKPEITEDMIFECFAAAQQSADSTETAKSFVDVEEYENQIMYPEFARWAKKAGYPKLATLFMKVAGEEKLHSVWLRELYQEMGQPARGEDARGVAEGVALVEEVDALAARGTLFHHYRTDNKGMVTAVNLIVATVQNNAAMGMSVKKAAQDVIVDGKTDDAILNLVEMGFRAYDPCFGCATHHLPGQMPLEVTIRNPDGSVRERLSKNLG